MDAGGEAEEATRRTGPSAERLEGPRERAGGVAVSMGRSAEDVTRTSRELGAPEPPSQCCLSGGWVRACSTCGVSVPERRSEPLIAACDAAGMRTCGA